MPTSPSTASESVVGEALDWVPANIRGRLVVYLSLPGHVDCIDLEAGSARSVWQPDLDAPSLTVDSTATVVVAANATGAQICDVDGLGRLVPWPMRPLELAGWAVLAVRPVPSSYSSTTQVVELLLDDGTGTQRREVARSGARQPQRLTHRLIRAVGTSSGFVGITDDGWLATDEHRLGTSALLRSPAVGFDGSESDGVVSLVISTASATHLVRVDGDEVEVSLAAPVPQLIDVRSVRNAPEESALARTTTGLIELTAQEGPARAPGRTEAFRIGTAELEDDWLDDVPVHDVFISYSRHDASGSADDVYARLTHVGLSVFLDREANLANRFQPLIYGALRRALSVVIIWSPELTRGWTESAHGMSQLKEIKSWTSAGGSGQLPWTITTVLMLDGVTLDSIPAQITDVSNVYQDTGRLCAELAASLRQSKLKWPEDTVTTA